MYSAAAATVPPVPPVPPAPSATGADVLLFLSFQGLRGKDLLSKSDPFAVVSVNGVPAGRTEVWVTHQVNMTGLTGAYPGLGEGFLVDRQGRLLARADLA